MNAAGDGASAAVLRARLRNVYWVGGGSGAGRSVIARRIAARHGLSLYSTDDVMADHGRRSAPGDWPLLSKFAAMDMDERWVSRSPETMLETFHWFQGEAFDMIAQDLLALPEEPGVLAEGFRLLPRLVKPLLGKPDHGLWLLPTPRFRRAAFSSRGSTWEIPRKTSDPDRALRNLLERDALFTDRLRGETEHLGLRAIEVDVTMTEDDLAQQVTAALRLRSPAGQDT
jgi:hypothetical protein